MTTTPPAPPLLDTSHGCFIARPPDAASSASQLVLRGINLSGGCKVPRSYPVRRGAESSSETAPAAELASRASAEPQIELRADPATGSWTWCVPKEGRMKTHLRKGFWEGMEAGGEDGWFSGAPFPMGSDDEGEADVREDTRAGKGGDVG